MMTDRLLSELPAAPSEVGYYRRAKWQVTGSPIVFELYYDYGFTEDWHHPDGYYSVMQGLYGDPTKWYVVAWPGCAWDGASLYPDFRWMMMPSLRHDILHWLIKRGLIPEIYNDVIDLELYQAILNGKEPIPLRQGGNSKFVRKLRAKAVCRATHLADEKLDASGPDIQWKRVLV